MPTIKPRITITIEPHTYEVIDRLASLQKCSKSSVVSELIDSVAHALSRTVALLEAAQSAPEETKRGLRQVVDDVHENLIEKAGDSIAQMDFILGKFSEAAEEPTPGPVTRGSGFPPKAPQSVKKAIKTRVSKK